MKGNWALSLILIFSSQLINISQAKVDPPNYNFSIDSLAIFFPGKSLKAIQDKFGKGELMNTKGDTRVFKFYVAYVRYRFPVIIQVKQGTILDFFARLPSYFSHDIFHQSLINRLGKQDRYMKYERSAVYIWNKSEKESLQHVYSGACTITCFPQYYSVTPYTPTSAGGVVGDFKSLMQQFNESAALF
jgi:hypothetical protein